MPEKLRDAALSFVEKASKDDWKRFAEYGERRNTVLYAWLRWLVLLEAGLFSLMTGQLFARAQAMPLAQLLWAKAALLLTATSILAGAVALFGEVALGRRLLAAHLRSLSPSPVTPTGVRPFFAGTPKACRIAEWLCYIAFLGSIAAWMRVIWLL